MSDIPRFSIVTPFRSRVQWVYNTMPASLFLAERKDHEVIMSLDTVDFRWECRKKGWLEGTPPEYKTPDGGISIVGADKIRRERMYLQLEKLRPYLLKRGVKFIESGDHSGAHSGGLRACHAGNIGMQLATQPWIVLWDEDLVLTRGWDRLLWERMRNRDPQKTMVMPYSLHVAGYIQGASMADVSYDWVEYNRKWACNEYQFPFELEHRQEMNPEPIQRLHYSTFEEYSRRITRAGEWEEPCGVRDRGHTCTWLIHRGLFDRVGGWPVLDEHTAGHDMHFDDRCGALGVTKVITKDCFALQTKAFAKYQENFGEGWDEYWSLVDESLAVGL